MGISQAATAVMVFLSGLLPASCHKTTASTPSKPATTVATNTVAARSVVRNLGELSLTNHCDTYLEFSNGEICTLTPKILDRNNVRITLALESKNDYGETQNFHVRQVIIKPDKPLEVAVGGLNLTFTPHVVSSE